jgi:hypothetical protein
MLMNILINWRTGKDMMGILLYNCVLKMFVISTYLEEKINGRDQHIIVIRGQKRL